MRYPWQHCYACSTFYMHLTYIYWPQSLAGSLGRGMAWCIRAVRIWDEKHLYIIALFCLGRSAVEIALFIEMPSSTLILHMTHNATTMPLNLFFQPFIIAHVCDAKLSAA
jgi:hypothetical protein